MDIEELRKRVIWKHISGTPALKLSIGEYAQLRDCMNVAFWKECAEAPFRKNNIENRAFKLIIHGVGILVSDEAEIEYGLRTIAGILA